MAVKFTGINLSGLEFGGGIGGVLWTDYVSNGNPQYDYWSGAGANTVRLPFTWERLQPQANGALDQGYLQLLHDAVDYAKAHGQLLILDMHNFGGYFGQSMAGGSTSLRAAYADVWAKLANEFKDEDNVWFGIMNEPHDIDVSTWMRFAQAATNAIRGTGAENKILVPTVDWSGAHRFNDPDYADEKAAYEAFVDSADNFAFEIHQYLDQNNSGTSADAVDGKGATVLKGVANWARAKGYELFLGEFGVAANGQNADEYADLLKYMNNNSDVFLGWTAWGAGEWWPPSYHYYLGSLGSSGTNILDDFFNPNPVDYENEIINPTLVGTARGETLHGTSGVDRILGGGGDDAIFGHAGRDVLNGEAGNDKMSGGPGRDTFKYEPGGGVDHVSDFNVASDIVKLKLNGISSFADLQPMLHQWGRNAAIFIDANDYLVLSHVSLGSLRAGNFRFSNDLSANLVTGTSAGETVNGTKGIDNIRAGAGNDVLYGHAGNDILGGQQGNDTLFGEAGRDTFVFRTGGGIDYVDDFSLAEDHVRLDLNGVNSFADVQARLQQWGPNTAIYAGPNDYLVLENVNVASLTASHFSIV